MRTGWSNGGPHTERAIHVDPCSRFLCASTHLSCRIEGSRVYISCLNANHGPVVEWRQFFRAHAALRVGRDLGHSSLAKSHQRQRLEQRALYFFPHDDADLRCTEQPWSSTFQPARASKA